MDTNHAMSLDAVQNCEPENLQLQNSTTVVDYSESDLPIPSVEVASRNQRKRSPSGDSFDAGGSLSIKRRQHVKCEQEVMEVGNCEAEKINPFQTSAIELEDFGNIGKLPNVLMTTERPRAAVVNKNVLDAEVPVMKESEMVQDSEEKLDSRFECQGSVREDDNESVEESNLGSDVDGSPLTIEAKEELLLEKYHKALGLLRPVSVSLESQNIAIGDLIQRFQKILGEVSELERPDSSVANDRMKALKFAVLKNLSALFQQQSNSARALEYLVAASEFDYTDLVMMHCMGELAMKLNNFPLAANFFQDALTIRSSHWPSLDAMITLLFAMNHLQTCLHYCLIALRLEPSYSRALTISRRIFDEHDEFREEWRGPLRNASIFVDQTLPKSSQKFLNEAEEIRKRWCTRNPDAYNLPKLDFPKLDKLTFEKLAETIENTYEHACTERLWNAVISVNQPALYSPLVLNEEESDMSISAVGNSTMSSDGFDAADTAVNKNSETQAVKSKARKVDPVCLEFAEKRRSTRNKAGPRNDEIVIRELLQKYISSIFGSINAAEIDRVDSVDKDKESQMQSTINAPHKAPKLFADDVNNEATQVLQFLNSTKEVRIHEIIRMFLQFLAERWNFEWPQTLIKYYMSLYFRIAHQELFPSYLNYNSSMETVTRKAILFSLIALEFIVDGWMKQGQITDVPPNFEKQLNYLSSWPYSDEFLGEEDKSMHLRILFLMYKWYFLKNEMGLLQSCLEETLERMDDSTVVVLPNLVFKNTLSKGLVSSWLSGKKTLNQLTDLEASAQAHHYADVIKIAHDIIASNNETNNPNAVTFFQAVHAKAILNAAEKIGDIILYSSMVEAMTTNMLTQWNQISEELDSSKKVNVRFALLEACDSAAKYYLQKPFSADISSAVLQRWALSVIEICVLSVHTVDGSVRKPTTLSPWMLLYWIMVKAEELSSSPKRGDETIHYLEEVHNYLGEHGPSGWCTVGNGAFLHLSVDRLMEELNERHSKENSSKNSEIPLDDIEYNIEQCFDCLYGFSKSNNRYLKHHNCRHAELTLSRAASLYTFFEPEKLPEFDGYRTDCISQEFVTVITKIRPLIGNVPFAISRDFLNAYIKSFDPLTETPALPQLSAFIENSKPEDRICKNCFYLLADYHYKNGENAQAMLLYMTDLCINPHRFDSWAGLALNKGAQVDSKLRSFALKPDKQIFNDAKESIQCFTIALKLRPKCEQLCIECGSLIYALHSYISRQIAQSAQFRIFKEEKLQLKRDKDCMIHLAQKIFLKAEECDERSEAWLSQYLLGKTYEKLEKDKPWKYLAQYSSAAECLHLDSARYPSRIAYYKTPELAVEALEMFYRSFASSLKFLCRSFKTSENQNIDSLKAVEFYLTKMENSHFARQEEYDPEIEKAHSDGEQFVSERVLENMVLSHIEADDINMRDLKEWRQVLIDRCLEGLRICLRRYPEHYKSMYRLARYYYEFSSDKNHLQITKDLLLGTTINWQEVPYMPCAGLFAQRKPTMFFKGVWHIRSEEVQRQLSFASHMFQAVSLVIHVLGDTRENFLLVQIFQQLLKPPDSDAKRFLRVDDYHFLADLAMNRALLSVINRVDDYDTDACSEDVRISFLREVLKMWHTARKEKLGKKNIRLSNAMLAHAFLRLVEGIHRSHCPVGDQEVSPDVIGRALKYIQQVQIKLKPVLKPTVTINLSTGLPDQPDSPIASEGSMENSSVVKGNLVVQEPLSSTSSAVKEPELGAVIPLQSEGNSAEHLMPEFSEDDLFGLDLGLNTACLSAADFDLVLMSPPTLDLLENGAKE